MAPAAAAGNAVSISGEIVRNFESEGGAVLVPCEQLFELVRSGKYCHQCRQKTENLMAVCMNRSKKPCPLHYCCRCLKNRYHENADEAVALGGWHCPKCRGICNCSVCGKRKDDDKVPEVFGRIVVDTSLRYDAVPRFFIDLNVDLNEDIGDGFDITNCHNEASTSISLGTHNNRMSPYAYGQTDYKHLAYMDRQNGPGLAASTHALDSDVDMPLGIDAETVASIDMSPNDVGHALQLLEFCKAFRQALSLSEEDPEIILKDLFNHSNNEESQGPASEFQSKLTSMIEDDTQEQCPMPSTWKNGSSDTDPSSKLQLLNFLCDEALNTIVFRNWINSYKKDGEAISASVERKSPYQSPAKVKEDESSMSQQPEDINPDNVSNKKFKPDALRSEPKYANASGQRFWNFGCSTNDMDLYVQDFGEEPMAQDKWFKFNPQQKDMVERYLSSFCVKSLKRGRAT